MDDVDAVLKSEASSSRSDDEPIASTVLRQKSSRHVSGNDVEILYVEKSGRSWRQEAEPLQQAPPTDAGDDDGSDDTVIVGFDQPGASSAALGQTSAAASRSQKVKKPSQDNGRKHHDLSRATGSLNHTTGSLNHTTGSLRYKCPHCAQVFQHRRKMQEHAAACPSVTRPSGKTNAKPASSKQKEKRVYTCSLCGLENAYTPYHLGHMEMHRLGLLNFKCFFCSALFQNTVGRYKHMVRTHDFTSAQNSQQQQHTNSSVSNPQMNSHASNHKDNIQVSKLKTNGKVPVAKSATIHKVMKPQANSKALKTASAAQRHRGKVVVSLSGGAEESAENRVHQLPAARKASSTSSGKCYECEHCGRTFLDKHLLMSHLRLECSRSLYQECLADQVSAAGLTAVSTPLGQ